MNQLRTVTPEQIASLFRTILQVVGGMLVAKGYLNDGQWTAIGGGVLTVVTTAWGLWARSDANLITSAAASPAVQRVVAPGAPDLVQSAGASKVTSA